MPVICISGYVIYRLLDYKLYESAIYFYLLTIQQHETNYEHGRMLMSSAGTGTEIPWKANVKYLKMYYWFSTYNEEARDKSKSEICFGFNNND